MDETATLTSKSQITVPKAIREALALGPGDKIRFVPSLNGYRLVAVKADITAMRGVFARPGRRPVTIEEMQQAVEQAAVRRYERAVARPKRPAR